MKIKLHKRTKIVEIDNGDKLIINCGANVSHEEITSFSKQLEIAINSNETNLIVFGVPKLYVIKSRKLNKRERIE